jgi:hypothetical protein
MKIDFSSRADVTANAAASAGKKQAKAARKKYDAWQRAVQALPEPDFSGNQLNAEQFYNTYWFPGSEFGFNSFDTSNKGAFGDPNPGLRAGVIAGVKPDWYSSKLNGDFQAVADNFKSAFNDYSTLYNQTRDVTAIRGQLDQQQAVQQQEVQRLQEEQTQRLGSIQSAGATVANSLRILATRPTSGGPTAQQTKQNKATAAKTTSPSASLRIGASGRSTGVGMNLGG